MRARTVNSLLVVGSIAVALALVEAALRLGNAYVPPDDPMLPQQPELFQPDAAVGYRLWPSRTTAYRYPRESTELIPVVSNSDGFRNGRDFDTPDDRRRILVVGDSFVFGQGVRAEERLTERLEALEPLWRVDNMGMIGWGLDLMVRAIEQYARNARPDTVVLCVYTDDFRRLLPYYAGAGYAYPKFELDGSKLVTVPFPYPKFWERLRLVQWLYQTQWNRDRNRLALNEALLDRFLADAGTFGFRPVVVFFPGRGDNDEDQARRGFLRQWATRHAVSFADLTGAINRAGIDNVYIRDNWHWNADGHRIAAGVLARLLRRDPAGAKAVR